jgi:predicted DNA-binding ribbon-helix-helix protein
MPPVIVKHSVSISGHQTSISLEAKFWELLRQNARERGISTNALITEIDSGRDGNLSSALRLYVLDRLLDRINASPDLQNNA